MGKSTGLRRSFWERHLDKWASLHQIPVTRRESFKNKVFNLINRNIDFRTAETTVSTFARGFK